MGSREHLISFPNGLELSTHVEEVFREADNVPCIFPPIFSKKSLLASFLLPSNEFREGFSLCINVLMGFGLAVAV